jgi:hypothetical protein
MKPGAKHRVDPRISSDRFLRFLGSQDTCPGWMMTRLGSSRTSTQPLGPPLQSLLREARARAGPAAQR